MLLSVMPLAPQIDNSLGFTTSFAFYARDLKSPAGHYRVTQPTRMPIYYWSRVSTARTRCSSNSYLRSLHYPIASLMSSFEKMERRTV
jgi:hypothetical protein